MEEEKDEKEKWMRIKWRRERPPIKNRLEEEKEDKQEKRIEKKEKGEGWVPMRRDGGGGAAMEGDGLWVAWREKRI